jgi:hypothetical protein
MLGVQERAGIRVLPKGYIKRHAARSAGVGVGGLLGAAVSATATEMVKRQDKPAVSEMPDFRRAAYLSVTDDEIVLIKIKPGLVSGKLDEILARVPRSEVAGAEYHGGMISKFDVTFSDDGVWQFEVAKGGGKDAKEVADLLRD